MSKGDTKTLFLVAAGTILAGLILRYAGRGPIFSDAMKGFNGDPTGFSF